MTLQVTLSDFTALLLLTHFFQMHPFSTSLKTSETLQFFDVFKRERVDLEQMD